MAGKELAKKDQWVALATVDEQTLRDYLFWLKDPINEKQQSLFLNICKVNNLNPFKREVYAVWYGDNFSIITGYQVYIDKANSTGLLNGWECEIIKDKEWKVEGAKVIIHRKDWDKPFVWEIDFDEFAGTYYDKYKKKQVLNKIWSTKWKFMIKKVVIGQGFRLCFPSELGWLPYLAEEIANKDDKDIADAQIIDQDDQPEEKATEEKVVEKVEEKPVKKAPVKKSTTKKAPVKKATPKVEEKPEEKVVETTEVAEKSGLDEVIDAMPDDEDVPLPEADDVALSTNKIKQVQIKWKEFAEKSGWNFEDSERKRKATMKKYFDVESAKEMTEDQADEFIEKINQAISKIIYKD